MKKVEIHGRRRLLDGFFQVDEITLAHQLLDEGRIGDAKTLIALMWLRARQAGGGG